MTSWTEARRLAYAAADPLPVTQVPVAAALGLVLGADLWALAALPPFDMASMDGWAVCGPGPWRVIGRTLAGQPAAPALGDGLAVEIATGAAVPPRCDGVVPVELGVLLGEELTAGPPAGRHVRRAGEECAPRTAVLAAGAVLRPAALGLAAAVGHDVLAVHPRPRVMALVTGAELLGAGLPGDGQIRDAVGPLLPGVVAGCGGALTGIARLGDDREELMAAIRDSSADVILTSGASSVGRADHLPAVLVATGAELIVSGVDVRPGHPQLLARLPDGRLLVGLPGNPLAALSALVTLVAPLLARLAGRAVPALACARLTDPIRGAALGVRLVPVRLAGGLARPTGHGGSAMLRGAALADGFAVAAGDLPAGTDVVVVPLP